MTIVPKFEKLEDRILLTAEPTATLDGPDSINIGDQDIGFTVTFDNTSGDDTPGDDTDGDVGFLPYVDVVLPQGEDGDDGITFDGATFLGTDIVPEILMFDVNGEAIHPLAVDAMGDPLIISGTPGDTLLVFTLPYGSFSPAQTPVDIELNLDFDPRMDLAPPPQISVNGGFALGQTAQDDPETDPTIVGATDTFTITPQVFDVEKFNDAPESETATGPNYPRVWTIEVDIATGQTLDDIVVTDMLPNNVVYLGGFTSSVAEDALTEPALNVASNGSELTVGYDGPITGVDGVDITIQFEYFVNNVDANGADVINPATGDETTSINEVEVAADWVPVDPRDDEVRLTETAQDTLTDKSIAIQKGGVVVDDQNVTGFSPGDTIEYTLDIQVSDFFTFGDLVITDTLGDGLELDTGFTPTFTVVEEGATTVNGEDIAVTAVDNPTTGEQVLTFNLSDALLAETGDGILTGDLANDATQSGATTVQVVYRAVILSEFTTPTGDAPVSQGDIIANNVTLDSNVLNNADNNIVEDAQSDTSAFEFQIPFGFIESKTVSAINGAAPTGDLLISAGDEVTFSILYNAPQGAYESLVISDFLPLPVFDATEMTTFDDGLTGTIPPSGTATFGQLPADYAANGGQVPGTITVNATSNSFELELGSLTTPTREEALIEILFTVTVVDAIFADGLLLTNQSTVNEQNTEGGAVATTEIAQFTYAEPVLNLTKGVVAFDSDNASLTAAAGPAGVTFTDISAGGAPFTGTINSDGVAATAIDSDITGIDAGDTVRFAITVENTGASPGGAFDIRVSDTLPDGFSIPPGGLNLQVFDGTGAAVTFTELTGGLFGDGIELTDGMTRGAVGAANDTSGENIAVIFYDLLADQTVEPSDTMPNTATLFNYSAFEGAIDRADEVNDADTLVDVAIATTLDPTVDKALLSTEFPNADSNGNQVLIGETITYRITIEVPEGTIDNLTLEDRTRQFGNDPVDGTLEILSGEIVAFGANLSSENGLTLGSTATLVDAQLGDGINDGFTFDFGDLENTADNDGHIGGTNDAADQIVIEVTARANAAAPTQIGDILTNQARMRYQVTDENGDTRTETLQDNQDVRVLEPSVTIDKAAGPEFVEGDNTATFTLTVTAADGQFNSSAYDLQVIDLVDDPDLTLDAGSVVLSGASGNATVTTGNTAGDTTILVDVTQLDPGEVLTITYTATVSPAPLVGDQLVNEADLTYDSTPIDDNPFERDYEAEADAFVTVREPDITKTVIDTSFDETQETPTVELNIGEEVTFELVATIPEGRAPIIITDSLPTTPGILTFVSAEVTAVGGNLTGALLSVGDSGVQSGSDIVFDFGTITNTPDGMQDALDIIRIEVTAIVSQDPSTASGDVLTNTATLDYGLGEVEDTADVTVTEPILTIEKTGAPLTGDAGDVVDYTLVIEHDGASTGPAYDLVIADPLIASFLTLNDGTVTATIDGVAIPAAQIVTGNGAGDTAIRIEVPLLDQGQALEITYSGTLTQAVTYDQSLTNTATADYDSNPSDDPADGRLADQISDDETFVTDSPTLAKEVFDTEYDDTAGNQVNIGEDITYRLTIDLPEGTSDITLADVLPDGIDYVSSTVVSITTGATTTGLSVGDDGVNAGQTTTFDFGEVVSTATAGAGADQIIVEIVARVNPNATNVEGVTLENNATLTFENGTATADATVEVVEPVLTMTKSGTPVAGDAGDLVDYTVTVEHDGASSGPAFDIVVLDDMAAGLLDLSEGTVTAEIDGVAIPAAQITLGNTAGDTTVRIDVPQLDQGEVLVVTYTAALSQDVSYNQTITNTATTDYDSSDEDDPAIGRAGEQLSDTQNVDTPEPTFSKEIDRTNQDETAGAEVTIGEEITYRFTIEVPQGTSDISLTDVLPTGLIYVSSEIIDIDDDITTTGLGEGDEGVNAGANTVFDFGEVVSAATTASGDDQIIVELTARVADIPGNVATTMLQNNATLTFENGTLMDDATVEIIEPLLVMEKTGAPLAGDAGDETTYTLTIEHDPTSSAPAYDVLILDDMAAGLLDLSVGTVVAQIDGVDIPAAQIVSGNTAGDTTIRIEVPVLEEGQVLTVEYVAALSQDVSYNQTITNTATTDYDSADSDDPTIGRAGDQLEDDESVVTPEPTFEKEIFSTNQDETPGDDLTIGEEVTYRLTITLPEGTSDIVVEDVLQDGLVYVSSEVFSFEMGVTSTGLGVGDEGVNVGQTTTFDLGEVVSAASTNPGDDVIIIEVTARVDTNASNVNGVTLRNDATMTFENGSLTAFETVDIIEPLLVFDKAVTPATGDAGDRLTYTLTVEHDPTSNAPAYDIKVQDFLFDPALSLEAGSVVAQIGTVTIPATQITEGNAGDDTTVVVDVPVLEQGEVLTVTFTVLLDESTTFLANIDNRATADYDSAASDDPAIGRPGDQLADEERITTPGPDLTKEVFTTSVDETAGTDVGIGELITYRLTIDLPQGTSDLVLEDVLPAGLVYVSSTVVDIDDDISTTGLGEGDEGVNSGQTTTFDFGEMVSAPTLTTGDDQIIVEIVARIDDVMANAAGVMLTNDATLTFENGTVEADATVEIVEPLLVMEKTVNPTAADGGDTLNYTITIEHDPNSSAAAFDVLVVDDTFLTEVALDFDGGSVAVLIDGVAAADAIINIGDDPADTSLSVLVPVLEIGETLTVTFTATVADAAPFDSTITNEASTDYDSNPSDDPNDGRAGTQLTDDAEFVTPPPTIDKSLLDAGDSNLVVGELVEYRIRIELPDGTSPLTLTDVMPTLDSSDGVISFQSGSVISIGSGISNSDLAVSDMPTSDDLIGADGFDDTVVFDFGTVTVVENADVDYNVIVVEVVGLVEDIAANQRGDGFTNTATLDYGTGTVSDTEDVSLGEPEIFLDKEGSLLALAPGDTVTYTLTIEHTVASDAEAQDITITDLLADPDLDLVNGTVTAMIVGANGSPAPVIVQGNGGEGVLEVSLATLNLGDQLVITYDATLDPGAPAAQSFFNTATADYDSLSGPGGRTDSAVDQYRVATVPALIKSVANTSFAETEAEQGDPLQTDVGIGEQVTFSYEIFLPELLSEDLIFTDQLPVLNTGTFTFESVTIDSVGVDLDLRDTTLDGMGGLEDGGGNSVISEVGGLITINFGDVDNTNLDNDVDNDQRIVISVTGFIDGGDAENVAGVDLVNAASVALTVENPPGNITMFEVTDQQTIEIVEPDLNIEKSVTPAEADAGDVLTYTIQVTHDPASTAPAYDIVVTDPLLANLTLDTTSVMTDQGVVTTGGTPGDTTLQIDIPVLDIGQTATITFQATLGDGALFNSTETNTATLVYDSDPADVSAAQRTYGPETDDASVTTPSPTVAKAVFDSSVDETDGAALVVGETVTYQITIDMPEGSSPMTLVDTLPDMGATLSFQSAQIFSQTPNVSFSAPPTINNVGAVTVFDFNTVTVAGVDGGTGGQIVLELVALVEDVPAVQDGASFTNMVDLNFNGGLVEAEATVTIVEPEIEIEKTGPAAGNPGDVLDYALTVTHTDDSTAAAFDIIIADTLSDPNLILDPMSISATVGGVAVDPSAITITNAGGQDGFSISVPVLLLGQTIEVTYQAQLDPNAPAANTFTNSATLAYDSIGEDDEVPGATGRSATDSDDHSLPTIPSIEKTIIDTSYDETIGSNLGIGEEVTFRLDVSIGEGDYDRLVITDQLPTGAAGVLSFVSATLDTTLTGVPLGAGAPTVSTIDTDGDTFQDRITIDFGAVTNPFNGMLGAEDRIVVELVARVEDLPQTAAGAGLNNNAAVDARLDGVNLDPQRDVAPTTVVEPDLAIDKAVNVTDADAGDVIDFTLTITHTIDSSGPAYDVILQDMLADTGLELVANTAALTIDMVDQSGLITTGNTAGDTVIRADIPVLDFMQTAVLTFSAVVTDAAEFNGTVDNEATLDYDSNPSDDPADGRIYDQETDETSIATPSPTFAKSLLTTSSPETMTGEGGDAAVEDIGIGEVVTYRFATVLPEGTAPLVITDQLPLDGVFEFVGVTVTPGTGVSGAGLANPGTMFVDTNMDGNNDQLTINLGAVTNTGNDNAAGGAGDLFVDVQIRVLDDPANERGDVFTNTAELDFGTGTLTDDETVEIVEPALSIAKALNVTEADAGDIITYTLTVTHDAESNAPAYDLIIQDLLADTGLDLEPGGSTLTVGGVSQPTFITEGNAADDTIARADIPVLELGQTAVFTFTAVVTDAVEFNGSVENEASLNYDSDPEDDPTIGRNYDQETDDQSFTTPAPTFEKSVLTSSNDDTVGLNVAIGEIVTYRFGASLPEGTAPISLTDQLPLTGEFELIGLTTTAGAGVSGDNLAAPAFSFVDTNGDGVADFLSVDAGVVTNTGQDNASGGAGDLFIDVQFRVIATPDVVEGAIFTNTAEFDFGTGVITDDAAIRIVEPDISIEKSVSPPAPFIGDTVTYSIVISNDADATAPAYNLVVTDPIPEDMVFQVGSVTVSDNALATPDNTATTLIVAIPRLAPGESVTITFDAMVAFDATPLSIITNTAGVEGSSDPDVEGRPIDLEDDADLAIQFVSGAKDVGQSYGGIDDETFLPVLTIDPIFSGTAEPGSQVMLTMIGRNGQPLGVQTMLTGAGGHWVIRFPQIDLPVLDHDFDGFYASSRLFDDPTGLFNDLDEPLIPSPETGRFAPIGAQPEDANYSLRMQIAPGPRGLEAFSTFNARSYFVPANIGLPVVGEDRMTVAEVFEELPDVTLENLMRQARDPLANGLNRFNYEFLAASSAVSG